MHMLCQDKDGYEAVAASIKQIFAQASQGLEQAYDGFPEGAKFDVPFLIDSKGCTPIQLALGIRDANNRDGDEG